MFVDEVQVFVKGGRGGDGSGSFRRERETGVLELLLVAPLSTHQIVWGRLRAIWGQFAPAAVTRWK